MNRNEFNRFVSDGVIPGKEDIAGLRELTDLFPWFQSAHLVLLRGLKESSDIKFDTQLKSSALYVADREILYHYLFLNQSVQDFRITVKAEPVRKAVEEPVNDNESADIQIPVREEAVKQETVSEIALSEPAITDTENDATSLRSREDLISEIESRLKEINHLQSGDVRPLEEEEAVNPVADEALIREVNPAVEETAIEGAIPAVVETAIEEAIPAAEGEEEVVFEIDIEPVSANRSEIVESVETPGSEDLLELASSDESAEEVVTDNLSPVDLIERFIRENPRLERLTVHEAGPVKDLSEDSAEETGSFITETLARIYVNQGYYSKAINIYEKLTLKYPEKSIYFASRIEKIKELIK